MPALKNTRWEAFAQHLATGMTRDEAYERAGYKPHRQAAHRLLTTVDVKARVTELSAGIAEKAEWTAADRLAALKRIADKAETEDMRVAVSAIGEANKMQGSHAPEKRAFTDGDGTPMMPALIQLVAPDGNGKA
jgi:phage terminase small subunit